MDWWQHGVELTRSGIGAVVIDAPGQGLTRYRHAHYFSGDWRESYEAVIDFVQGQSGGCPIGVLGNSFSGALVTHLGAQFPQLQAGANNGGLERVPTLMRKSSTWADKFARMCRPGLSKREVLEIFESISLKAHDMDLSGSYLQIQGAVDPLVPNAAAGRIFRGVSAPDKRLVSFEQGEHLVSRYPADKHALISSWFRSQLV